MRDTVRGKGTNGITEAENNHIQGSEGLISEAKFPDLFPNLLNRIHFWSIGRYKEETDVIGDNQSLRFMSGRAITAEQDQVILVLFGQRLQKNVGADGIAVWQHQKAAFTGSRLNGSIGVAIFADMMAWNCRPHALFAPAVLGFIDPSETSLILEHQAHFSAVSLMSVDFFLHFLHFFFNFFEAAMTSSLAFFGCLLRGITFRHPFRSST